MSESAVWAIILVGGFATYLIRLSFLVLLPQDRMPEPLRRGLRFIPSAVLAALLTPELLTPTGALDLSPSNHRLLAGALAALAAWRFRNTWVTIAVGMAALWAFSSL